VHCLHPRLQVCAGRSISFCKRSTISAARALLAKRLECVQLAGAFQPYSSRKSGSKLHALQALRERGARDQNREASGVRGIPALCPREHSSHQPLEGSKKNWRGPLFRSAPVLSDHARRSVLLPFQPLSDALVNACGTRAWKPWEQPAPGRLRAEPAVEPRRQGAWLAALPERQSRRKALNWR
jgi:hypothetical protein